MPLLKTDDAARGLWSPYLGPPSMRWPTASYPAYGTFFGLALVSAGVTFANRPTIGFWIIVELPLVLLGSLLVTRFIFKRIKGDVTLNYQIRTLRAELGAPRPQTRTHARTRTIPASTFTDHRDSR